MVESRHPLAVVIAKDSDVTSSPIYSLPIELISLMTYIFAQNIKVVLFHHRNLHALV
jgi:hypothetical protein